jgi:hypothetical protein
MKLLVDEPLYTRTEECLRFLRELGGGRDDGAERAPERYHLYWQGGLGLKQAFAVKSILATQDLASAELWLWLDAKRGHEGHAENPLLRPLLPFLRVRRFDPKVEARQFDDEFRPKPTVRSYRDFFPGAFAYHWHNRWDVPEHEDSYFGLFNRELDGILRDKLGIEIAGPDESPPCHGARPPLTSRSQPEGG